MQQSLAQRTEAFNAEGDRSESFLTAECLSNILLHVIDHPHPYKPTLQITMSLKRFQQVPDSAVPRRRGGVLGVRALPLVARAGHNAEVGNEHEQDGQDSDDTEDGVDDDCDLS